MNDSWWIDTLLAGFLAVMLLGILLIRRPALGAGKLMAGGGRQLTLLEKLLPLKTAREAGIEPSQALIPIVLAKLTALFSFPFAWFGVTGGEAQATSLALTGGIGFMAPDYVLWMLASRRKKRITALLSQFADFLVVMLRSGMTLGTALDRVCEHGLPGRHPLTKELRGTLVQIRAGQDSCVAFAELANATGVPGLKRLSTTLEIGQRTGVSIVDSLSSKADIFREQYIQRIEKQLNRKTVEALLPILLLGIPMFGVIVFFPTGVQIFEAYTLFTSSW